MSSAAIACVQTPDATSTQSAVMTAWRFVLVSMIVFPIFLCPPHSVAVNRKRHGFLPGNPGWHPTKRIEKSGSGGTCGRRYRETRQSDFAANREALPDGGSTNHG